MQTPSEKLSSVPQTPGVYLMRNASGHIIYIGKAKNLRARLGSYFKGGPHDAKTTTMIQKIADFDYFLTNTENDALALEANLINQHKPHYNILLKDNKSYPYIMVTNKFIQITRKPKQTATARCFGPYFNGIWASDLMDTLFDLFPLVRAGKNKLSGDADALACVKSFLKGEREFNAREILTERMNTAAGLEQFEIAIRYRNGINFLDKLKERTITQTGRDLNLDVFAHQTGGEFVVFSVLTVRAGKLIGIQNYTETTSIEDDLLDSFIRQYYLAHPKQGEVITTAEKGIKRKLLDMARANAKEYLETSIEKIAFKTEFTLGACRELGELLGIATPKKIECFDISHTHGTETVASMVVFTDGVPDRKLYRKFKIRSHNTNDDYLSMREVLNRRLNRTEWEYPDLIVLDGGRGQLSAVSCPLPFIALSENNEIFLPNKSEPLILSKRSYALRLLQRLRDEAHRFANDYRKVLHKKNRV